MQQQQKKEGSLWAFGVWAFGAIPLWGGLALLVGHSWLKLSQEPYLALHSYALDRPIYSHGFADGSEVTATSNKESQQTTLLVVEQTIGPKGGLCEVHRRVVFTDTGDLVTLATWDNCNPSGIVEMDLPRLVRFDHRPTGMTENYNGITYQAEFGSDHQRERVRSLVDGLIKQLDAIYHFVPKHKAA